MLTYTSQLYAEVVTMLPNVSYTPYATSSWGETGDIIILAQFEQGALISEMRNLLAETCDVMRSCIESDDDSTMPPLISAEEMDMI